MRFWIRIVPLATIGLVATSATSWAQNNCIECHRSMLDDEDLSRPALAMSEDVHATAGVSCADCHGGDPTLTIVAGDYDPAKAPGTGFVGAPSPAEIPELCGQCHADASYMQRFDPNAPVDQLAQYRTSGHGKGLAAGATDVAQCVSCHHAHGVLPVDDPRAPVYPTRVVETCGSCHADPEHMASYDVPTDQVAEYRGSVHGKAISGGDLSAPTCNTCHGNHGATPPGLSSVSLVCGNCHAIQKAFFDESPHREAFADIGEPECETCHDNHAVQPATDQLLGVEEGQICGDCHFEGEEPYLVAQRLERDVGELKIALEEASATVETAARAGMEVSDAELILIDADQTLVKARNAVHAVSPEVLAEQTDAGRRLAEEAREYGLAALEELQFRRRGLGVSVFFIVLVVIALYLKMRQMERRTS